MSPGGEKSRGLILYCGKLNYTAGPEVNTTALGDCANSHNEKVQEGKWKQRIFDSLCNFCCLFKTALRGKEKEKREREHGDKFKILGGNGECHFPRQIT